MKILAVAMCVLAVGNHWTGRLQEQTGAPVAPTGADACPLAPAHQGNVRPEAWRIEENVYNNDFYGLRYEFPKGWFIDKALMENDANQKKQHASRPDPKDPMYGVWLDIQCGHLLLAVSRDDWKTTGGEDRGMGITHILLNVSDVVFRHNITTAKDLLNSRKESLRETSQVVREPADYVFDGQLFSRMDLKETALPVMERGGKIRSPGGTVYEAEIIGVRNGYWIEFDFAADSLQELEELFQTLDSLQFK
jgi:hypothetical protein